MECGYLWHGGYLHRAFLVARLAQVFADRQSIWRGGRALEVTCRGERFSGFIFGLVKRMMPDVGPIFQAYANDLKRAAENA